MTSSVTTDAAGVGRHLTQLRQHLLMLLADATQMVMLMLKDRRRICSKESAMDVKMEEAAVIGAGLGTMN